MTSLRGKSAVVIGGSSGVGRATVKALISEGVHVTSWIGNHSRRRGMMISRHRFISAAAYGAMNGITAEAFMKRFAAPLDADGVASAIVGALRGDVPAGANAIAVRGTGIESLT